MNVGRMQTGHATTAGGSCVVLNGLRGNSGVPLHPRLLLMRVHDDVTSAFRIQSTAIRRQAAGTNQPLERRPFSL